MFKFCNLCIADSYWKEWTLEMVRGGCARVMLRHKLTFLLKLVRVSPFSTKPCAKIGFTALMSTPERLHRRLRVQQDVRATVDQLRS